MDTPTENTTPDSKGAVTRLLHRIAGGRLLAVLGFIAVIIGGGDLLVPAVITSARRRRGLLGRQHGNHHSYSVSRLIAL